MPEKTPRRTTREPRTSLTMRASIIAISIAVVFMVTWATYIMATTTIETIEVEGAYHASMEGIVDLAGIHPGDTLFAAEPERIALRVARHRWVEHATVTRWLTGTLHISVTERIPVALVVGKTGLPVYYLDGEGVMLPVDTLARYDVPLLRGFDDDPERAVKVDDEDTLELLQVLASLGPGTDDLISDVVRNSTGDGLEVVTVPFRQKKSLRVKLGHGGYEQKFAKLAAFWEQAVVGQTDKSIEWIDLRFDGQVVTKGT